MEIIKCGTNIVTKSENIHAIVTCASIRFTRVTYEISYFKNGIYQTVWLSDEEFVSDKDIEKQKIGFKKE